MLAEEWRTTLPAEAATEVGADDDTVGDGGMIGRLLIAVGLAFGALALVHFIARVLS